VLRFAFKFHETHIIKPLFSHQAEDGHGLWL